MKNRDSLKVWIEKNQTCAIECIDDTEIRAPLISVVVPTYQHCKFLEDCIESIVTCLTGLSAEILIGEDDSTDGTREVALALQAKYPKLIRLFLHKRGNKIFVNGRPTGRFNFLYLLFETKGKYTAVCDGDDCWIDNEKIKSQLALFGKISDLRLVFTNSVSDSICPLEYDDSILEFDARAFMYTNPLGSNTASAIWMSEHLDARDLVTLFRLPYADVVVWLSLLRSGKAARINKPMVMYRRHPGGAFSGLNWPEAQAQNVYQWLMMKQHFSDLNWASDSVYGSSLVLKQGIATKADLSHNTVKELVMEVWMRIIQKIK